MRRNNKPITIQVFGQPFNVPAGFLKIMKKEEISEVGLRKFLEDEIRDCGGPEEWGIEECKNCYTHMVCRKSRLTHFTIIPIYVYEYWRHRIHDRDWMVFLYLNYKIDSIPRMKGRDFCELSEEEIADDCNIHVLAVPKYINSLERKGLITVDQEERWLPCPILNKGKKGKIQYAAYRIYTINWRRKLNQLGIRYK